MGATLDRFFKTVSKASRLVVQEWICWLRHRYRAGAPQTHCYSSVFRDQVGGSPGKGRAGSSTPSQAACSGSCALMRRERLQPMHVLWSEVLVGGLVIFTIHITLILNILDLNSFIVIYCDYWKVESYSTFSTGSALALPCFCAFPVIATEHPLCRFDEEPGI